MVKHGGKGVHYGLEKGLTVAPTFKMTTHEGGKTENEIVVSFQFQF